VAIEIMDSSPPKPELHVYREPRFALPMSARPRREPEPVAIDRQLPLQLYKEPEARKQRKPNAGVHPARRAVNVAAGVIAFGLLLPVLAATAVILLTGSSGSIIERPIELRRDGRGFFRAYRFRMSGRRLAELPRLINVIDGDVQLF
jgi:lipopolysaccharide/colanic/teichoic acid biosynthesis glycosyltransferase